MNHTLALQLTNSTQNSTIIFSDWLDWMVQIAVVVIGVVLTYSFTIGTNRRKQQYDLKQVYFDALGVIWKLHYTNLEFMRLKAKYDNKISYEMDRLNQQLKIQQPEPQDELAKFKKANEIKENKIFFEQHEKSLDNLSIQRSENIILLGIHFGKIRIVANKNIVSLFNRMISIIYLESRYAAEDENEKIEEAKREYEKTIEELANAMRSDLDIGQKKRWQLWK